MVRIAVRLAILAVFGGLLWLVLSFLVMLTIIGIPIAAWVMIPVLGLWVGYRVLRGWLALSGGRPVGV